jgi:hypothetical protein
MPVGRVDTSRFWEQVLQVVDEGRVIPVIGPDLLLLPQGDAPTLLFPLLAERLAQYLELNDEASPAGQSLNSVACRYLAQGNDPQDIYSALKAVMPPDSELPVPEALVKLAEIGSLKTFVSLTFDSLLERAINQVRFGGQRKTAVLSYSPNRTADLDPAATGDRPVVFHLFGKLSAVPDYAVTEEDTLEFIHSLQNETKRPQRLFDELNQAHLFIIGGSISQWLTRFFLRASRRERLLLARGKTDIVADASVRDDAGLVLFLQQFKTGTKIFPGSALEFVNELHQRWTARHPPQETAAAAAPVAPATAAQTMEEGAVFLSYASEDRAHVQRINDELERAGVDVWFDKADLNAGDDYELKIKRNIERCSLFVPVISANCLTPKRRFFRIEWNHAQGVAQQVPPSMQFILPVAVDDTSPAEPFLPDAWRALHWQRLIGGQTTPAFVETVRRLYRDYQKSALAR